MHKLMSYFKSLSIVTGKSSAGFVSMEGTGIVRRIGSNVKLLNPGDRVVFVHPGDLDLVVQCHEIFCQKIKGDLEVSAY